MTVDNRIDESLSALMDGEVTELELRRVLKEVSDRSEHRETWRRYQIASAAMKRDLPPRFSDLSGSISAAIQQEPTHSKRFSAISRSLGKVAIAASVAVVSVLGVQQIQLASVDSTPTAAVAAESATPSGDAQFQLPAGFDYPPVSARTVSAGSEMQTQARTPVLVTARPVDVAIDEEAVREFFNTQMQRHTESAAHASSSQGLLPFARLPQGDNNP
jgi:sigma-E factor negative regulatory protein RseA